MTAEIIPFPQPSIIIEVYRVEYVGLKEYENEIDELEVMWEPDGTMSGSCLTGRVKELPHNIRCLLAEFIANKLLEI